jgi:hypothetical protein
MSYAHVLTKLRDVKRELVALDEEATFQQQIEDLHRKLYVLAGNMGGDPDPSYPEGVRTSVETWKVTRLKDLAQAIRSLEKDHE